MSVLLLSPAARRRKLAVHTRHVNRLKRDIGRSFWEIGRRLAEVRGERLWAEDYRSFDAWLQQAVDLSRSTALRFMRVSAAFQEDVAERFGVEKLDALMAWSASLPAEERPVSLLAGRVALEERTVSVEQASATELRKGTELLSGRAGAPTDELVARAARVADQLPWTGLNKVRLKRGADGSLRGTFVDVPLDQFDALVDAVREHLVPLATDAPPEGEVTLVEGRIHLG